MIVTVVPSFINGTVTVPASKSAMQRACALALLNNGTTIIHNPGKSNDDLAALNIIKTAGVSVMEDKESLFIKSAGKINIKGPVHCGESGLSLRMFTPVLALSDTAVTITGEGSLLHRPVGFFDSVLPLLHVKVQTNNSFLPIKIQGPLIPADITVDGSMSSQYLTGLLFAFAKAAKSKVVITVTDLKSKPYIDMSLQMLSQFGYTVAIEGYERFEISPVEDEQRDVIYYTEGDWSGAAFLLVAGAIAGDITLKGLTNASTQADKAILDVLIKCGAAVTVNTDNIAITRSDQLKPFVFDATDCPDLFPPLAALAANCKGTSIIKGTSRLAAKESNRALTLTDVFTKMGIEISIINDEMIIVGGKVKPAIVDGHHDHRIVMAAAIAGLHGTGNVVINGAEAVSKSYPDFFEHLKLLGTNVSLV